jgi:hypothetical protein
MAIWIRPTRKCLGAKADLTEKGLHKNSRRCGGALSGATQVPGKGKVAFADHGKLLDLRNTFGTGGCEALAAPIDLFLPGEQSVYQPDLVIVCDPAQLSPRGIEGPPDLVVEILSPSTASRDMAKKRWAYEAGGIPEYLLVDPEDRWGLLLRLEAGRYQEVCRIDWGGLLPLLGGRLPLKLLSGAEAVG